MPTTALTGTCRSPPTPTPTPWPSRSGWAGSTCSPTRGPTATARTRPGAPTSAPRWPTTPWRSAGSTSPWRPAPTSGPGRPGPSSRAWPGWTAARWPSGGPPTTATGACAHRPSTAGASGWTGRRASWSSRTVSTAAPTTAAWPSTSAPTSPAPSNAVGPSWSGADGHGRRGATLTLPDELAWRRLEGQTDPPVGWYSPAFGARVPTVTLVGSGRVGDGRALTTVLQLDPGTTP